MEFHHINMFKKLVQLTWVDVRNHGGLVNNAVPAC